MRSPGIRLKLWLAAMGVMLFSVACVTLSAGISSSVFMKSAVYDSLHKQHATIDLELKNLINDANYLHSRLITDAGFNELVLGEAEDKREAFGQIVGRLSVEAFAEISVIYDMPGRPPFSYPGLLPPTEADYAFTRTVIDERRLLSVGGIRGGGGEKYLMLGKQINIPYNTTLRAAAVYYLKESALKNTYDGSVGYEGALSFIADERSVVSHPESVYAGSTLYETDGLFADGPSHAVRNMDGKRSLIVVSPLDTLNGRFSLNWKLVSVIPYRSVFGSATTMLILIVCLGLAFMLLATPLFLRLAGSITAPVRKLTRYIRAYGKTGKDPSPDPGESKSGDELDELQEAYDTMVARIEKLMEKNKADMEMKRKLELEALQMQINPHFLYNALDTVSWIAKLEKQEAIEKLAMALASFFRISLHNGDKYVTVAEEIELIKSYVQMENIRRDGNFAIRYLVDPETENIKILKLILQPLLENAFKHGIALKKDGEIEVRTGIENGRLYMSIADNGDGFDADKPVAHGPLSGGYGIKNIRERLALEYGEGARLTLSSRPGSGTEAVVEIPLDRLEPPAEHNHD